MSPEAAAPFPAAAAMESAGPWLQLLWLASPALPVGGFSYSEGLEAAVESGLVASENEASQWLLAQLCTSLAPGDLALVAQAMPAWARQDEARLRALSQWVHTTRETAELRAQSDQMGKSLLDWLRNHTTATPQAMALAQQLQPSYPLVWALAAQSAGAAVPQALLAYAFGWAENLVQAAIKAVPLGQSAGQRILSALVAQMPQAVATALSHTDDTRQAFAPMLAILSSRHEVQYSRLFRS